jgi:ribonuclease HI
MQTIEIFTDGACEPNPGPGAWAAIIKTAETYTEISAYCPDTTNNRMEMKAAIEAILRIEHRRQITVHSDSEILVLGMSQPDRIARRNKRARKGELPNADLWQQLDHLAAVHSITWDWVRGHNGHPENERCDEMASAALANRKKPIPAQFIKFE